MRAAYSSQVRISPHAVRDVREAIEAIGREDSETAKAFMDAVVRAADLIGNHPHIGLPRTRIAPAELRFLVLAGFAGVLVYRAASPHPRILRVVHGLRMLPALLRDLYSP